jgi:hypothetical protein
MRLSSLAQKWLMKHFGHHPQDKFGLKIPFNMQAYLKGWGHVLMTKFDESEKTRLSGFLFQNIRF